MSSSSAFMRGEGTRVLAKRSTAECKVSRRSTPDCNHRVHGGHRGTALDRSGMIQVRESRTSHHTTAFALQLFRLEVRHQGLDDWLQLAADHFLQLMDGQPNAVVGDAVLRAIVRAYLFAAIARTYHRFALSRPPLLLLLHPSFLTSGTQNRHGLF